MLRYIYIYVCVCVNSLGDQMGRALASSVEGQEFEHRSGQVKDLEIGTRCFHI